MVDFPPGYSPIRQIGSGGFGIVWEALEKVSGQHVALKMPRRRLAAEELARFAREVRLQSQLEHPNILPVLDYDLDDDYPWFTAPLALHNFEDGIHVMSERGAITTFIQVLEGMAYAHHNRVLHRDLKPANVLLFTDDLGVNTAAVSDFGLGRAFTRDTPFVTKSGMGAGTPGFAPPEQWIDFKLVDERADIYSLGRILSFVLDSVTTPESSPIRRRFEYCLRTATAMDPAHRYGSVAEFQADVELVLHRPRSLRRPVDVAQEMLQTLAETGNFGVDATRPLAQLLVEHSMDDRLLLRILPRLSSRLLAALLSDHGPAMTLAMQAFAGHLEKPLTLDVALAAMRMAEEVLGETHNVDLRQTALLLVVTLAVKYNVAESRYIAARCVMSEDDPTSLQALVQYVRSDPLVAQWCKETLPIASLPPILRDAVMEV